MLKHYEKVFDIFEANTQRDKYNIIKIRDGLRSSLFYSNQEFCLLGLLFKLQGIIP